ncbi:MAG: rhodanese-like domain-containing protein [Luminiphilus sp.]|nr:rhodanese-like domain-containing protein [Luminiphilus sp.]
MKPTYLGLLLLLWSAYGGAEMPDKNTQHAVALISQGATVIDVRTPIEIADGTLPDALSIIHTDIVAGVQALALPSDAPLVLYCRSGNRSGMAAAALQAQGYTQVTNGGSYQQLAAALDQISAP